MFMIYLENYIILKNIDAYDNLIKAIIGRIPIHVEECLKHINNISTVNNYHEEVNLFLKLIEILLKVQRLADKLSKTYTNYNKLN